MKQNLNFKNKKRPVVGVMFGGRSSEHEISIITALQAVTAMDTSKYHVKLIYVHPNGKWYTGQELFDKKFYTLFDASKVQQVTLLPEPGIGGLIPIENKVMLRDQVIPIDLFFLAFHGQYGEDGCIQGLLELADLSYTGCGVTSSAITMNKYVCKMFLQAHGIPVLPSTTVSRMRAQQDFGYIRKTVETVPGLEKYPFFVKPCHLGSSIGISRVESFAELQGALANIFKYDDEAIVEPCISNLLEINIAVLEGNPPRVSVVEIPFSSTGAALTYEDKYLQGSKKTSSGAGGMASLTRKINPTDLDAQIKQQVAEYALKAYNLLGCRGVSRLDFMMDQTTGRLYFNELNALPGSLAFYLWEKSSPRLLYTEVIEIMLQNATKRRGEQLSLQRNFGFKVLK